ncbi:MAG: 50S ribosomal protein L18 [Candidatus Wildermuthbacteria bacterium]|nr:50S ribosomal protein L18 [Candidatus Wildermuthbacteria bacterium]
MKRAVKVQRNIRHRRIRAKVSGTLQKPRLFVFRSNKHTYASLIDDQQGKTLGMVADSDMKSEKGKPAEIANEIGKRIALLAKEKNIATVVFDRGGNKYHGVVKAVAEGARSEGLIL